MLYVVTKTTVFGGNAPAFFETRAEAEFYKRATAVIEAARSSYFARFEDKYGIHYSSALSKLCVKLMKKTEKKEFYHLSDEENKVFDCFISFLSEQDCNITDTGDFIDFSDETFIWMQIFEIENIAFTD